MGQNKSQTTNIKSDHPALKRSNFSNEVIFLLNDHYFLINLILFFLKFFERLNFYSEKSTIHHKEIIAKYMEEEAFIREQQMAVQHRLDTQSTSNNKYEGEIKKKNSLLILFLLYFFNSQ